MLPSLPLPRPIQLQACPRSIAAVRPQLYLGLFRRRDEDRANARSDERRLVVPHVGQPRLPGEVRAMRDVDEPVLFASPKPATQPDHALVGCSLPHAISRGHAGCLLHRQEHRRPPSGGRLCSAAPSWSRLCSAGNIHACPNTRCLAPLRERTRREPTHGGVLLLSAPGVKPRHPPIHALHHEVDARMPSPVGIARAGDGLREKALDARAHEVTAGGVSTDIFTPGERRRHRFLQTCRVQVVQRCTSLLVQPVVIPTTVARNICDGQCLRCTSCSDGVLTRLRPRRRWWPCRRQGQACR